MGNIAIFGQTNEGFRTFADGAVEFGWGVKYVSGLAELQSLNTAENVIAVLFDADEDGSADLISIRCAAPGALPLACGRFAGSADWSGLLNAGAFHAMRQPFDPAEVRQSLGFVWASLHAHRGISTNNGKPVSQQG